MGWATNALGRAFNGLIGIFGGGAFMPTMPEISIGEGFYPQVVSTVAGIDSISRSFRSFREPLTLSLDTVIIPSIRTNFDVGGRPRWQGLAESTLKAQQTKKGKIRRHAHPILNDTGKLKSAATSKSNWTVTDSDVSLTGLDSEVNYAKYHQSGTRKMPKREFVGFQPEDIDGIEEIFSLWLDAQIKKGGFK